MHSAIKIAQFLHRKKELVHIDPDTEYSLVTVKLHHKGAVLREKKKGYLLGSNMYKISRGQFILSGIDARNGAFGIVPDDLDGAVVTNDFWYFDIDETKVKRDFFYWLTYTPIFLDACEKSSKGETQRIRLQKDVFFNYEFRFPSIEEQETFLRNIKKIDNSLSILKEEQNRQSIFITLLRQSILQEAIQGKLTAKWRQQNPKLISGNNHASKLLEKIKSEQSHLIKEGKTKKEEPLPVIAEDQKAFDLPDGWTWCRFGEICKIERGVSPKYCEVSEYRILNQKCVRWNRIESKWSKPVLSAWFKGLDKSNLTYVNDVLVNSTGEGTIGRSGIITSETEGFPFDTHVLRVSSSKTAMPEFLMYFINSVYGQNQTSELKGAKTTKQTELGVGNLRSFVFSLAPIDEQKEIIVRVNQLMANIDELEKQITERRDQAEMLMQSVLREALAG